MKQQPNKRQLEQGRQTVLINQAYRKPGVSGDYREQARV